MSREEPGDDSREMMTEQEVARYLRRKERTIYELIELTILPRTALSHLDIGLAVRSGQADAPGGCDIAELGKALCRSP